MLSRLVAHIHRRRLIRGQPKEYLDWRHLQRPHECVVCSYTAWVRLEKSIDLGPVQHECCEGNGVVDLEVRLARGHRIGAIATYGVAVPLVGVAWALGVIDLVAAATSVAWVVGARLFCWVAWRVAKRIDRRGAENKRLTP